MSAPLDPTAVDAAVAEVLAAPPFAGAAPASPWRQLLSFLERWYDESVTDLYFDNPAAFWLLTALLAFVLALLLVHLAVSLRDVVRALRRGAVPEVLAEVVAERPRLDGARGAFERGEHRLAIELAWSEVVKALGVGEVAGARTPRQVVRELRDDLDEGARRRLEELLRLHEGACYAGVNVSASAAGAALHAAGALLEARGA